VQAGDPSRPQRHSSHEAVSQAWQEAAEQQQQQRELQAPSDGVVPLPIIRGSPAPAPMQARALNNREAIEPAQVSLPQPARPPPQDQPSPRLPPPSIVLPPGPGQVQLVQRGNVLVLASMSRPSAAAQTVQQQDHSQQQTSAQQRITTSVARDMLPQQLTPMQQPTPAQQRAVNDPARDASAQQQTPVQQQSPLQLRGITSPPRGTPPSQRPAITTPAAARPTPGHAPQRDVVDTNLRRTPQQPGVESAPAQLPTPSEPAVPSLRCDSVAPAVLQHIAAGEHEAGHQCSPVKTTLPASQMVASPQRLRAVSSAAAEQEWADVMARKATPVGSPRYLSARCVHLIHACAETPMLFQQ